VILEDTLGLAGTRNNCGRSRMRQGEVQRRSPDGYVVFRAQGRNLLDPGGNRGRHCPVFEVTAARKHAGAIGAAHHEIDSLALRGRHQALECHLMIEERIPASLCGARVRLTETEQKIYRFDLIDAEALAFDHALVAQFR
jgi:hypothetical protein